MTARAPQHRVLTGQCRVSVEHEKKGVHISTTFAESFRVVSIRLVREQHSIIVVTWLLSESRVAQTLMGHPL